MEEHARRAAALCIAPNPYPSQPSMKPPAPAGLLLHLQLWSSGGTPMWQHHHGTCCGAGNQSHLPYRGNAPTAVHGALPTLPAAGCMCPGLRHPHPVQWSSSCHPTHLDIVCSRLQKGGDELGVSHRLPAKRNARLMCLACVTTHCADHFARHLSSPVDWPSCEWSSPPASQGQALGALPSLAATSNSSVDVCHTGRKRAEGLEAH